MPNETIKHYVEIKAFNQIRFNIKRSSLKRLLQICFRKQENTLRKKIRDINRKSEKGNWV